VQTPQEVKSAKRKISTVIAALICVVLIPVLIVNLTIIVKSFADPEQVPGFLGYKPLIVLSGSMEPTIAPGDIVVVKEVSAETLKEGDIIAYLRGKAVITHRIMEINNADGDRKFYTKGDNNNVDDGIAVAGERLEGKYLFRIPRVGNAAMFMQKPAGIILFIALPLLLFILYDVFRRRYYDRREIAATRQLEEELAAMKQKLAEVEASGTKDSENSKEAEPSEDFAEGIAGEKVSDEEDITNQTQ